MHTTFKIIQHYVVNIKVTSSILDKDKLLSFSPSRENPLKFSDLTPFFIRNSLFSIRSLMLDSHQHQSPFSPSHLKAHFTSDMTYRARCLKITLSWENQAIKGTACHSVISYSYEDIKGLHSVGGVGACKDG